MPPKKPPLTPEEKKRLKAEKKAEKKRLAELKKRQQRHDHLTREVTYGQLTVKQHERNWKKMLVNIALPRLREDLHFAWHNFERVVDFKAFTISLLMDEITDAEEQYSMNLRSVSENIDDMIIKFRDRLEELKADFENQITFIDASSEKEVEEMRTNAIESEEYIKVMLYGLEMARKEQEKLVRGEYLSKIDEETSKYANIIQTLRAGLERTYSKIWDDTKTFLTEYTAKTAERRKAYGSLSQQDTALQRLCAEHKIKLHKMQDQIKKLKIQYGSLQETEEEKLSDLSQERQYFSDAFWTLRCRLEADRALDVANLATLTVESNQSTEHLEKIAKRGKKLLALAAVCRKLETTEEKILPFPLPRSTSDAMQVYSDIKIDEYKNSANLQLFWQRMAQADAVRHSINEEREFLKRENKILKRKIHDYCECLNCPAYSEIISEKNYKRVGKVNVVDGNLVQKNYCKY